MFARFLASAALAASLIVAGSPAGAQMRRGSAPGDFDFYVLALSWSSGFCELGGAEKARKQCAPGAGLGFVVHGLWPQFDRGFPSRSGCVGSAAVTKTGVSGQNHDTFFFFHKLLGLCSSLAIKAFR